MEIVAAVGEALLSASVGPLIERLTSHELNIFVRQEKIDADIKDWEMILAEINALLDNAEDTQMTNPAVKIWLDEFRDLTYDIEDALDEFSTEAMKRGMMEDPQASTSKLQKLIHTCFTSSVFKNKMASRIKEITERLERIKARQEQTLNLRRITNGTRSNQLKERPPTTSLVDISYINRRNDEKEAIVQKLLGDGGSNNPISVFAIVGMGGIGKTTLAQQVYNHDAINEYFDIKVWVCVSEHFDVISLTRTILRNAYRHIRHLKDPEMHDLKDPEMHDLMHDLKDPEMHDLKDPEMHDLMHDLKDPEMHDLKDLDLNSLQETLRKLSQKKFLLILDDVWEEDYSLWDQLRRPFFSAASRSKIIVTTRKENAAPITGDVHVYRVEELSDDECLCLLAFHALGAANSFDARPDLKDIGKELVKRCNGLPLAAKVLGGLLRNKGKREQWERVLRNNKWETGNSVHPTLRLSYDDLPSHLKRCFVYCAIFPKDYEFHRVELVRLWMAEGFLHRPQGGKLMEDLGIDYFDDLVSRSLFQWSSSEKSTEISTSGSSYELTNSVSSPKFVMHDLISDLAQTIAGDICYNYENKTEVDSKYEKVRHASFSFGQDSQDYVVYSQMKRLRTIWRRGDSEPDREFDGNKMEELSTHSKCIRVLSLPNCSITKLSNSIGDLIHLRYINLSRTHIQQIPDSVSTLFNMQTLQLRHCQFLKKLPDKIGNLVNLLHLDISYTHMLQKLPSSIGMLTNLQTLSKFVVQEGDGTTIAELKNFFCGGLSNQGLENRTTIAELENLNNLRGSLSIQGLENVQDAKSANLKMKQGLEELKLKWKNWYRRIHQEKKDMSVLESLEPPHQNLKRLTISSYDGAKFPSWMNNTHLFSKLVSLELRDCQKTEVLPPLGQLCSLKELRITGLKAVKTIGVEFYGNATAPFPSLERLEISGMLQWSKWSHGNMGGEGFPNLQKLKLFICPKLIGNFPRGLHSLKGMYVGRCCALECIDTRDGRESLLEELEISDCSSLKYFQRNFMLPTSLRILKISNCGNLLSLPDGLMVQDDNTRQSESHLEELQIVGCQGLTSFPNGKCPAALKILRIGGPICMQLESAISEKNTSTLETIQISHNDDIKAFPSTDCFQSLQRLRIEECQNLSLLPIRMQSHFPSLRYLTIRRCPNVGSLIEDGGLPRNLTMLEMELCENMRPPIPIAEWGLGMLSSLRFLEVIGRCPATADVVSFPDDNCCWLPNSLKWLDISDFVSLESVSMGLKMLTSLNHLCIRGSPKLRHLPKEALPSPLIYVAIYGCPLLEAHYLENRGEYSSIVEFND